jgi:hypothetical protein
MTDERYNLVFDVERSIRYHERRRAFYQSVDTSVNALNLISGTAAVASLTALKFIGPVLPTVAGSLVAVLSYINLTMQSTTMASLHSQLRQRYIELRLRIEDDADGAIKELVKARLMIEKDEPTMYRMLDLIDNVAQVTIGRSWLNYRHDLIPE